MNQKYYIDIISISFGDFIYKMICNNYNIKLNKTVIGVDIYHLFKTTRK